MFWKDRIQQLGLLVLLLMLVMLARLAELQIVRHQELKERQTLQAERQYVVPARRGRILDRNGRLLAFDVVAHDVSLLGRDVRKADLPLIAAALDMSEAAIQTAMRAGGAFITLAREIPLTPAAVKQLRSLPGVCLDQRNARQYPYGNLAAQYIGFTDLEGVGVEGIEKAFDSVLRGQPGTVESWSDQEGNRIGQRVLKAPEDGGDVILSLDVDLQRIADDELQRAVHESGARGGSVLLLDPHTGDLLACANAPAPVERDGTYCADSWRNRAVYDQFEPGSTLKPITASAALRYRIASFNTWIYAERGAARFGAAGVVRDANRKGYGWLQFSQAFALSSNIVFAKLAERLTSEQLYNELRAFGLGNRTGIQLPVEPAGQLALPRSWSGRSRLTLGYGQEVSVTAIQLAGLYTTIANGGRLLQPRVALRSVDAGGHFRVQYPVRVVRQVMDTELAAALRRLCTATVETGTGRGATVEGITVAGKTGTAQKAEDGRYVARYVSSFGGFAPAGAPRVVCLVVLDEPRGSYHWGSHSAAPTFQHIVEAVLRCTSFLEPETGDLRVVRSTELDGEAASLGSPLRIATLGHAALPDLRGLPLRTAARWLQRLGLEAETKGAGRVRAQWPAPGESVAAGGVVRIECVPEAAPAQHASMTWR